MSIIKLNPTSGRDAPDLRIKYNKFRVYEHKLVFGGRNAYTRSSIVLKKQV